MTTTGATGVGGKGQLCFIYGAIVHFDDQADCCRDAEEHGTVAFQIRDKRSPPVPYSNSLYFPRYFDEEKYDAGDFEFKWTFGTLAEAVEYVRELLDNQWFYTIVQECWQKRIWIDVLRYAGIIQFV